MAELGPEDKQVSADHGWNTPRDPKSLHTIKEVAWPIGEAAKYCLPTDQGLCLSFPTATIRH